ncbi:MAG: futalosine hydrolase [Bacteroidetes bacterium]|nr:futalosine hydrolase [Bacteroidota bacterium]
MNILVVSATQFEVKPLLDFLGIALPETGMNHANMDFEDKEIHVLITGVGMVNTAFMMGRYINSLYDLVINVGVCGAFDRNLELGDIVHVTEDILSEMGAEDGDDFLTYDKLNLPGEYKFSNQLSDKFKELVALKKVKGITVNTVHGNEHTIGKIAHLYNPDVESMEGAAFYASCRRAGENFTQIRAISNYVEKRDRSKWQMPLAIKQLNDFLINFVRETPNT